MVLDRALIAPGHNNDVLNPGLQRLLDPVLDDGLVNQGQHFLRLGFRGGEKPRSQPGGGKDGLANFVRHQHTVSPRLGQIRKSCLKSRCIFRYNKAMADALLDLAKELWAKAYEQQMQGDLELAV